ncbi:SgcJ/EcaC family oxidoreductase [Paraburkholderia sp. LEh10]|uniref:SgcJ/EcaC family oxidoreductase n=1 Tax=Paraburkholderia sp. LEh10 TaxID=2821353 RepID=UPI001AE7C61D|nr:SgcJ/EcaC family oxidoreductase [Paraburkholderia sp. LEh10]MBP0594366.1 SgcJ/EcaC family oxidoreductase [Paraburkholderia sp. LEh10]
MTDDERAIRQLIDTWLAASKAGDTDTVLSLMTDDAVFMVAGQKPFGKTAFMAMSEEQKNVDIDGKSEILELQVLGDWAFLRSHLEVTITPKDGLAPMRRAGNTLTILRKEIDGRWLLARDANLLVPQP